MKNLFTLATVLFSVFIIHAQQYKPADDKSSVKFSIRNFGISTGGDFKGLDGKIEFDKVSPEKTVFNISISSATVNTDNSSRDSHLRKEEYFDVAQYPKISFVSEKVTTRGAGYLVSGKLTIKGTTKNISFPFKATAGTDGYLFEGSFQLNRRDYGVGGSSMVLSDNVTVSLAVFGKNL